MVGFETGLTYILPGTADAGTFEPGFVDALPPLSGRAARVFVLLYHVKAQVPPRGLGRFEYGAVEVKASMLQTFESGVVQSLQGSVPSGSFEAGPVDAFPASTGEAVQMFELPYGLESRIRFYPLGSFEYGLLDILAGVSNVPLYSYPEALLEIPYDVAGEALPDNLVEATFALAYHILGVVENAFELPYRLVGTEAAGVRLWVIPYRIWGSTEASFELPYNVLGPFAHFRLIRQRDGRLRTYDLRSGVPADFALLPSDAPLTVDPARGLVFQHVSSGVQMLTALPAGSWALEADFDYRPVQVDDEGGLVAWGEGSRRFALVHALMDARVPSLRLSYRAGVVSGWARFGDTYTYWGRQVIGRSQVGGLILLGATGTSMAVSAIRIHRSGGVEVDGLFRGMSAEIRGTDGISVASARQDQPFGRVYLDIGSRVWPFAGYLSVMDGAGNIVATSELSSFSGGDAWAFVMPLELYLEGTQLLDPAAISRLGQAGSPQRLLLYNPTDVPTPKLTLRLYPADDSTLEEVPVRLYGDELGTMAGEPKLDLVVGSLEPMAGRYFWINPLRPQDLVVDQSRYAFDLAVEVQS